MNDTVYRQQAINAFYLIRCELQMMDDTQTADKVMHGLWLAEKAIKALPSAQPEIIRCGECKYLMPDGRCYEFADDNIRPSASDFCSAGVRK